MTKTAAAVTTGVGVLGTLFFDHMFVEVVTLGVTAVGAYSYVKSKATELVPWGR